MKTYYSTEEWEVRFGEHIKNLRLRQNIDQRTFATKAGIALNALKNLENGKGCTLKTLIKTLRMLGKVEWLDTLAPTATISPLQLLKSQATKRLRASSQRKSTNTPEEHK